MTHFTYEMPDPRPSIKRRILFPANAANNAVLLVTQTRISGGCTFAPPPCDRDKPGWEEFFGTADSLWDANAEMADDEGYEE